MRGRPSSIGYSSTSRSDRPSDMSRAWRATLYLIAGALIMALLILATFLFLTRTSTGVNLVARFAIERLEREIEGELQVDSVSTRRLLGGVFIHGLALPGT